MLTSLPLSNWTDVQTTRILDREVRELHTLARLTDPYPKSKAHNRENPQVLLLQQGVKRCPVFYASQSDPSLGVMTTVLEAHALPVADQDTAITLNALWAMDTSKLWEPATVNPQGLVPQVTRKENSGGNVQRVRCIHVGELSLPFLLETNHGLVRLLIANHPQAGLLHKAPFVTYLKLHLLNHHVRWNERWEHNLQTALQNVPEVPC